MSSLEKIPVTILTGFLGAGKTTLSAKLAARIMEKDKQLRPTLVSAESELSNRRDDLGLLLKAAQHTET